MRHWYRVARCCTRLLSDESGPTATEYAVLLALVLVVIVASVGALGTSLNGEYQNITGTLFP